MLAISGIGVICSLIRFNPLPFDMAWIAIILCGLPLLLEAFIGLITSFVIKANVLVSLALIVSVCIGEIFAAGEVAFIMQLGALLEELTLAKANAGIEKLVHPRRSIQSPPQSAVLSRPCVARYCLSNQVYESPILWVNKKDCRKAIFFSLVGMEGLEPPTSSM